MKHRRWLRALSILGGALLLETSSALYGAEVESPALSTTPATIPAPAHNAAIHILDGIGDEAVRQALFAEQLGAAVPGAAATLDLELDWERRPLGGVTDFFQYDILLTDAPQIQRQGNQREFHYDSERCGIAVSRDLALTNLDRETLRRIFNGAISDWRELELPPGPIFPAGIRESGAGYRAFFWNVMRRDQLNPKAFSDLEQLRRDTLLLQDSKELVALLHGGKNIIVFGDAATLQAAGWPLLNIDGIAPDSPQYPLQLTRRALLIPGNPLESFFARLSLLATATEPPPTNAAPPTTAVPNVTTSASAE